MAFQFRVRDLMSTGVKTLRRNDSLKLADELMSMERIRHLPVLDDEEDVLVGIVSQRDMFRGALANVVGYGRAAQDKLFESIRVKDIMVSDVIVAAPDEPVAVAAGRMLDKRVGCLPVVDGGRLVGILAESDFVRLLTRKPV